MRRLLLTSFVIAASCVAVATSAGGIAFWRAFLRGDVPPATDPALVLVLAGGDGASIPPATPAEQGLDAEALEAAAATARQLGASAFAVARRGHAVFVWSADGQDGRVRSTLLSRLVLTAGGAALGDSGLAAWTPGQNGQGSLRNPWSERSRLRYGFAPALPGIDVVSWASRVSLELWRPLAARDAWVERDAEGTARLHCCVWLRPGDALALATALLGGGQVNGERLMDADASARAMDALHDGVAPRGAEPFGSRPARLWRDAEGTRLYSFPAQELVILLVRAEESRLTDETQIAHQVLRGVIDRAAVPDAPATRELVPAH